MMLSTNFFYGNLFILRTMPHGSAARRVLRSIVERTNEFSPLAGKCGPSLRLRMSSFRLFLRP